MNEYRSHIIHYKLHPLNNQTIVYGQKKKKKGGMAKQNKNLL